MARYHMRRWGAVFCGLNGSRGSTGRISMGRSAVAIDLNGSGSAEATSRPISRSDCRASGGGASGIGSWWSKPPSIPWNDASRLKIASPSCTAETRRVVKLLPSRSRSTW